MHKICGYLKKIRQLGVENLLKMSFALLLIGLLIAGIAGCGAKESGSKENIDYTVVENEDLPSELKKLIEDKKDNTLRMTYTTKDYTYVVAGYGSKDTSGYSIRVNDVYKSGNAVYADFTLIGPSENEAVNEVKTTPYIVLKYEKREESVVFKM